MAQEDIILINSSIVRVASVMSHFVRVIPWDTGTVIPYQII